MPEISALLDRPAPERFDGAEAWSKLPADVQAEIGAIALEMAAVASLHDRLCQDDLPEIFHRTSDAATVELWRDLQAVTSDALPEDAFVASHGRMPRIPSLLGDVCRVCGCSQNDACDFGCGWAAEDLCTACVEGGHDHD
ncbi:hypothetical protein MKK88_13205 [Methylobacterium sp. E-005]|uniref:hypothetical protein n=1 Tax=Methylobacterium sp. E-005 TaxID=2836549 RepID=UPI001FBBEC99|nr:hypothetical protein [Methylobacterium sp. E-005]MCJ2086939.1 hypothetical protein [Methylobacterium sp. E-005]